MPTTKRNSTLSTRPRTVVCLCLLWACLSGCEDDNGVRAFQASLPCRPVLDPTGVVLGSDTSAGFDPAPRLVQNSDGRLFGSPMDGGRVLVWAPTGEFRGAIGRPGEGPGELAQGSLLSLFLVEDDTLYVRDGRFRWHVFDSTGKFVRSAPTGPLLGLANHTVFLPDGRIVGSYPKRSAPGTYRFQVATREGEWSKGLDLVDSADYLRLRERLVTAAVDGGFWAAPEDLARTGYRLERWDLDGVITDSIVLAAHWPWQPREVPLSSSPIFPSVTLLHQDSLGIIWIGLRVPKPGWRHGFDTMPYEAQIAAVDAYLDAIDPVSRSIIASIRLNAPDDAPVDFFDGSRLGFRAREDSISGLTTIELAKVDLDCSMSAHHL